MKYEEILARPATAEEVFALVAKLAPSLAGQHPGVQSAALAQLLAMWLAGHPNFTRDVFLEDHVKLVRKLIAPAERERFNGGQHPHNKQGTL